MTKEVSKKAAPTSDNTSTAYKKKIINLKNLGDYTNSGPGRPKQHGKDDGINITPEEIVHAVEYIRANNKRKKLPNMKQWGNHPD